MLFCAFQIYCLLLWSTEILVWLQAACTLSSQASDDIPRKALSSHRGWCTTPPPSVNGPLFPFVVRLFPLSVFPNQQKRIPCMGINIKNKSILSMTYLSVKTLILKMPLLYLFDLKWPTPKWNPIDPFCSALYVNCLQSMTSASFKWSLSSSVSLSVISVANYSYLKGVLIPPNSFT